MVKNKGDELCDITRADIFLVDFFWDEEERTNVQLCEEQKVKRAKTNSVK